MAYSVVMGPNNTSFALRMLQFSGCKIEFYNLGNFLSFYLKTGQTCDFGSVFVYLYNQANGTSP